MDIFNDILSSRKMKKIKNIKKDISGNGYLISAVFCFIFCVILSVGIQIYEIYILGDGIKNNLKDSIRYSVTKNWDETFMGSRQGYTGAYILKGDIFEEVIDKNDIMKELAEHMGLLREDNFYQKRNQDDLQYQLYNLQLNIKNSKFASDSSERFEVDASLILQTKIKFLNIEFPVEFFLTVKAAFSPLF